MRGGRWRAHRPAPVPRRVHVTDPRLVELRAWSRLAEELTEERVRLSNRVHHELWPMHLSRRCWKIADGDVAATWSSRSVGSRAHAGQSRTGCARRRSRNCSSTTTSAASTPTPVLRNLQEPRHQSWQGRGRGSQRSSAFAVYPVACRRQPRTAAGRRQSLMRCARRSARPMLTRERAFNDRTRHDPQIDARHWQNQSSRHCCARALAPEPA